MSGSKVRMAFGKKLAYGGVARKMGGKAGKGGNNRREAGRKNMYDLESLVRKYSEEHLRCVSEGKRISLSQLEECKKKKGKIPVDFVFVINIIDENDQPTDEFRMHLVDEKGNRPPVSESLLKMLDLVPWKNLPKCPKTKLPINALIPWPNRRGEVGKVELAPVRDTLQFRKALENKPAYKKLFKEGGKEACEEHLKPRVVDGFKCAMIDELEKCSKENASVIRNERQEGEGEEEEEEEEEKSEKRAKSAYSMLGKNKKNKKKEKKEKKEKKYFPRTAKVLRGNRMEATVEAADLRRGWTMDSTEFIFGTLVDKCKKIRERMRGEKGKSMEDLTEVVQTSASRSQLEEGQKKGKEKSEEREPEGGEGQEEMDTSEDTEKSPVAEVVPFENGATPARSKGSGFPEIGSVEHLKTMTFNGTLKGPHLVCAHILQLRARRMAEKNGEEGYEELWARPTKEQEPFLDKMIDREFGSDFRAGGEHNILESLPEYPGLSGAVKKQDPAFLYFVLAGMDMVEERRRNDLADAEGGIKDEKKKWEDEKKKWEEYLERERSENKRLKKSKEEWEKEAEEAKKKFEEDLKEAEEELAKEKKEKKELKKRKAEWKEEAEEAKKKFAKKEEQLKKSKEEWKKEAEEAKKKFEEELEEAREELAKEKEEKKELKKRKAEWEKEAEKAKKRKAELEEEAPLDYFVA